MLYHQLTGETKDVKISEQKLEEEYFFLRLKKN